MNFRAIRESDFVVINVQTLRVCFVNRSDIVKHISRASFWDKQNGGPLRLVDNVHSARVEYQDYELCDVLTIAGGAK